MGSEERGNWAVGDIESYPLGQNTPLIAVARLVEREGQEEVTGKSHACDRIASEELGQGAGNRSPADIDVKGNISKELYGISSIDSLYGQHINTCISETREQQIVPGSG